MITGFFKRKCLVFLSALLVACFSLSQLALASFTIDTDRLCSLELIYQHDDKPIEGATFEIYYVADVDEDVEYEIEDEFAPAGIDLGDDDSNAWYKDAETLHSFIEYEASEGIEIKPVAEGKTDENGELVFKNLEVGVYLIVGEDETIDGVEYDPVDTLLLLPEIEDDYQKIDYDPSIYPKKIVLYRIVPEEPDEPDEPSNPSNPSTPSDNEKIQLNVLKVWDDDGYESKRPEKVTVVLMKDGIQYDEVMLNDANNWRYTWENLDSDAEWRLVETDISNGYTVTSVRDGNTFVVTNTRKSPSSHSRKPAIPVYSETTTEAVSENITEQPTDNVPEDVPEIIDNPVETTTDSYITIDESENDQSDITQDFPPVQPKSEKLPQTGQLWWPIPVLLIGGFILFLAGRKMSGEKGNEK
jgi:hypothetical protein